MGRALPISSPIPKSRPADSLLARGLEPFVASLWILFVLVSLVVVVVWTFRIGEGALDRTVSNPDLRAALVWLLAHLDLAWIVLAAVNAYISVAASVGLPTIRRWAILTLVVVVGVAWVSVATGFPIGRIHYGSALGTKLGSVPVGLPLFWLATILGARVAVLRFRPRCAQWSLAVAVGVLAFITDLNLEPLAARIRGFWFWSAGSPGSPPVFDFPITGSVAWGILAALITFACRELNVAPSPRKPWEAMLIAAIFNAIFLAANVAHRLSH